jgi:gas vesicle protein
MEAAERSPSPQSTGEMIMRQDGNGFSALAKGLVIGSVLGAAAAFLYAPRDRAEIRSDISEEGVRSQFRGRPPFRTRIKKSFERGRHLRPSIGWLVISILASAVARISDLRSKKRG